jgi:NitT/TauT family transport system substrate-binding protein
MMGCLTVGTIGGGRWGVEVKRFLSVLTLAVALGLAACGPAAPTRMKIKVGYTNTVSFTGLFIAKDQGMFAKRGLDVDTVLLALTSTIPSAIVGGSIDIGGASPPVVLQAVEGGIDLVVVAGGAVNDIHNMTGSGVIARNGAGIHAPKDFEGRRVGVPGLGAYMHVMFRRWLAEKGVDDKKVNFVEIPLAQASDVLRSGNVDAMLVGEPFYSRIMSAKTGYLVSPYLSDLPDGLFSIYFASSRDWAGKNGEAIAAFHAALAEANVYLVDHPAESRAIVAKATNLPPDVVEATILPTLKLKVPPGDIDYWADTMVKQSLLKARPDAGKMIFSGSDSQ